MANLAARLPFAIIRTAASRWNANVLATGASLDDPRICHPAEVKAVWRADLGAIELRHQELDTVIANIPVNLHTLNP